MARHFVSASSMRLERTTTPVTTYTLTMCAWVRPTTVTVTQTAVAICRSGAAAYHALGITSGAKIFYEADAAGTNVDAIGTTNITTGVWHHLLCTGTSATARACFRDGVADGTNTTSNTPASIGRVEVGCILNNATYQSFFNGDIAEVAIWNVVLSQNEITMLAAGVSPAVVRPASLKVYAPLLTGASPEVDWIGATGLTLTNAPTVIDHPPIRYHHELTVVPSFAAGGSTDNISVATTGTSVPVFTLAGMSDQLSVTATGKSSPTFTLQGTDQIMVAVTGKSVPSFGLRGTDSIPIAATGRSVPSFTLQGIDQIVVAATGRSVPVFTLAGMSDQVSVATTGASVPSFNLQKTGAATFSLATAGASVPAFTLAGMSDQLSVAATGTSTPSFALQSVPPVGSGLLQRPLVGVGL